MKRQSILIGLLVLSLGVGILGYFSPVPVIGQQPEMTPVTEVQVQPRLPERVVDLGIGQISSVRACKCDLDDVDALYMGGIEVEVINHGPRGRAGGTLRVRFHNLSTGRSQTITRQVPVLDSHRNTRVVVVENPVLVKKSVGITAEIILPRGVRDSNLANNVKTIHSCSQYLG